MKGRNCAWGFCPKLYNFEHMLFRIEHPGPSIVPQKNVELTRRPQ